MWTPEEMLSYAVDKPLWYPPGTNWNYAHTNYVILGLALEKITGQARTTLLQEQVLDPLGLDDTTGTAGPPDIPEPVLHAFSSERRHFLRPGGHTVLRGVDLLEPVVDPRPGRDPDHRPCTI